MSYRDKRRTVQAGDDRRPNDHGEAPEQGKPVPVYLTPDQQERLPEYIDWQAANEESTPG